MARFTNLFSLLSLVATASAAAVVERNTLVARALGNTINPSSGQLPPPGPDPSTINPTDSNAIFSSVQQANQKRDVLLKKRGGYEQAFGGTGTGTTDRDAAVQGSGYLTFKRLDTYDLGACEAACDSNANCVFINLFYEFNTNAQYNPQIKCALYSDIHTAADKTRFGGQQLLPAPAGKSYIQQSVGYTANYAGDPPVPAGYQFVFGPTNGANQATGYMGFTLLDSYDVQACANACNGRAPDANGGACQYFNIWRAVVNGKPTTYTCAMYYLPTDASTATNTGQGNLKVTFSRGYSRITLVPDGGFESFTCSDNTDFCYTQSDAYWYGTSPPGGSADTLIFDHPPYAHSGHSAGTLGAGFATDDLPGTYTVASPLNTVAGKTYLITFFHQSSFNPPSTEATATLNVQWNSQTVWTFTGSVDWTYGSVTVTANGNDVLAFEGGGYPDYVFLDDVFVFLN